MGKSLKDNKKIHSLKIVFLSLVIFSSLVGFTSLIRPSLLIPLLGGIKNKDNPNVEWVTVYPLLNDWFADWIFQRGCEEIGGTTNYNFGIGQIVSISCLLPFDDSGKSCKYSSSCSGFCSYNGKIPDFCVEITEDYPWRSYLCEDEVEGVCSSFPSFTFYSYLRVNGNKMVEKFFRYPILQ
jgi:hypothetical protein